MQNKRPKRCPRLQNSVKKAGFHNIWLLSAHPESKFGFCIHNYLYFLKGSNKVKLWLLFKTLLESAFDMTFLRLFIFTKKKTDFYKVLYR